MRTLRLLLPVICLRLRATQLPPIQVPAPNVPVSKVQPIYTTSITSLTGAAPVGVSPLINGYNVVSAADTAMSSTTQSAPSVDMSKLTLGSSASDTSSSSAAGQPPPFPITTQTAMPAAQMPLPPSQSGPFPMTANMAPPTYYPSPQQRMDLPKPGGLMNMGGGSGLQSQFIPTQTTGGSQQQPPYMSPFSLSNFPTPASLPGGAIAPPRPPMFPMSSTATATTSGYQPPPAFFPMPPLSSLGISNTSPYPPPISGQPGAAASMFPPPLPQPAIPEQQKQWPSPYSSSSASGGHGHSHDDGHGHSHDGHGHSH